MTRIVRSYPEPEILLLKGQEKTTIDCGVYDANPTDFHSGQNSFDFDCDIYGHETVKRKLIQMQHNKCCFCESKITHVSFGDVEHFRPKKGYMADEHSELKRPGYYWLAYKWENLLFCCELCNRRFKKNLFPLLNEAKRAHSHHDDYANEEPEFIDPSLVDPSIHISFREDVPYAIEGSEQGEKTIIALGLRDRPNLVPRRRERLDIFNSLRDLISLLPEDFPEVIKARALIDQMSLESAEYAAMIRVALALP